MTNDISEVTRRGIIDFLLASGTSWSGRLQEDDFLARLYDLGQMPSTDHRIRNAAGDIRQHRVNWRDWEDDWVFFDSRFRILHGSDEDFIRFLCETLHPVVRPDEAEVQMLVDQYNRQLAVDGWRLVEVKQLSGKPIFGGQKGAARAEIFEEPTGWQKVDRQLQEVRLRLDTAKTEEQFQAVGLLCRECLISVAQELHHVETNATDAKRMLEEVIDKELKGGSNEEARAHAKAAVRLALALQHKRTADFKTGALCAEATFSVINILAILAGRRNPI